MSVRHSRYEHPKCKLFSCRIVDAIPCGCPLREANPLTALDQLQDRAFARSAARDLRSVDDWQRMNVCDECAPRLLGNWHVKRLRRVRGAVRDVA